MENLKTINSLEILLLNDHFLKKIFDEKLYQVASEKIAQENLIEHSQKQKRNLL